ncbi:MAG: sigma-70 family RNA polymerase sigma factor, partial [Muribaculaceae bacterium]|nr:sigma-70 family RNA polymerase sigma factor [Muribaculaceae bacterium]
ENLWIMTVREFEIGFRALYLPLGMYALRIVGDADDAEDVVGEAFARAWQAIEGGVEIENFKAFMYRCVRNECISFLRSRREHAALDEVPEVCDETVDTSARDAKIWRAVDALPEKCREVFLMSKRDGLSQEEIAEELGISIKTVKNQMTKAFSRLRDALSTGHKPFFLPFL